MFHCRSHFSLCKLVGSSKYSEMCKNISLLRAKTSGLQKHRWHSGNTGLLAGMPPRVTFIPVRLSSARLGLRRRPPFFFPQCLKLSGNGCFEVFGSCLSSSWTRCVTFIGKVRCNYSNPAPDNRVRAPHGPAPLCSHRFDFIYDLFEHVSSRNNQDTLKCGSKHRRPTVSSQFKVSLSCWLSRIYGCCDFRNWKQGWRM